MDYNKLKIILKEKRVNITALSKEIGLSRRGLYSALENETLKIEMVEKISEAIGVPITEFLELHEVLFPNTDDQETIVKQGKRILELEEQLEDKKDIIEYYKLQIKFWQNHFQKWQMYHDKVMLENPEFYKREEVLVNEMEKILKGNKKGDLEAIKGQIRSLHEEAEDKVNELFKLEPGYINNLFERDTIINRLEKGKNK